jgi:hypothetical protein
MADAVSLLCAGTSLARAVLLLRGYVRSHARLPLWSCLCFVGLALNNSLLVLDLIVLPERDLSLLRNLPALVGLGLRFFGLSWEAE